MDCSQTSMPGLSSELKVAQDRLLQLRKELLVERLASHRQPDNQKLKPAKTRLLDLAQVELYRRRRLAGVQVNHGSPYPSSDWIDSLLSQHTQLQNPPPPDTNHKSSITDKTVPVYPSILTAMLTASIRNNSHCFSNIGLFIALFSD